MDNLKKLNIETPKGDILSLLAEIEFDGIATEGQLMLTKFCFQAFTGEDIVENLKRVTLFESFTYSPTYCNLEFDNQIKKCLLKSYALTLCPDTIWNAECQPNKFKLDLTWAIIED